jgi:hypothetical protein
MVFARVFQKSVCAVGKAFVDIIFANRRRFQREFLSDLLGQIEFHDLEK